MSGIAVPGAVLSLRPVRADALAHDAARVPHRHPRVARSTSSICSRAPEWFGGWAPPLRYIVFLMPVLALGAASVWDRVSRGAIALVAAWTIGLVVHGLAFPVAALPHRQRRERGRRVALDAVPRRLLAPLPELHPPERRGVDRRGGGASLLVIARGAHASRRIRCFAIPLVALAMAAGFTLRAEARHARRLRGRARDPRGRRALSRARTPSCASRIAAVGC